MIKIFENIYQAEDFTEKITKKCCQSVSPFIVKCPSCKQIFCFHHVRVVKKAGKNQLVCFLCFYKY